MKPATPPPHPATMGRPETAQPLMKPAVLPPHPATVGRSATAQPLMKPAVLPPHAATVGRGATAQPLMKPAVAAQPHAATIGHTNRAPALLQRAAANPLSTASTAIWNKLTAGKQAKAATTISVFTCSDLNTYATTNDVGKLNKEANKEATAQGVTGAIEQAGAGFHAEMWAYLLATQNKLAITGIGASRACCAQCSAVLALQGIPAEQPSADEYKSWYNPLTVDDHCQPRDGLPNQQKAIPDFRNFSNNYWFFKDGDGKWKYDKTARGA